MARRDLDCRTCGKTPENRALHGRVANRTATLSGPENRVIFRASIVGVSVSSRRVFARFSSPVLLEFLGL